MPAPAARRSRNFREADRLRGGDRGRRLPRRRSRRRLPAARPPTRRTWWRRTAASATAGAARCPSALDAPPPIATTVVHRGRRCARTRCAGRSTGCAAHAPDRHPGGHRGAAGRWAGCGTDRRGPAGARGGCAARRWCHDAPAFRPARRATPGPRRAPARSWPGSRPARSSPGTSSRPSCAALADATVAVTGAVGLRRHGHPPLHAGCPRATWTPSTGRCSRSGARRSASWAPSTSASSRDEQLDRWWSLVLRDGPDLPEEARRRGRRSRRDDGADARRRRARRRLDLPIDGSDRRPAGPEPVDEGEAARRRKRDLYRLIDRFTGRPDLLSTPRTA